MYWRQVAIVKNILVAALLGDISNVGSGVMWLARQLKGPRGTGCSLSIATGAEHPINVLSYMGGLWM